MTKNITALILIVLGTTAAWAILGATILARTYSASSGLGPQVASIWGGPQQQTPPVATTAKTIQRLLNETSNGRTITKSVEETVTSAQSARRCRSFCW